MRRLIWAALVGVLGCGLSGCGVWPTKPQAPTPQQVPLRDPKGWISSAVVFDPGRFAGRWYVAESAVPGCAGAVQDWTRSGNGWQISGTDCTGGRAHAAGGHIALTGPSARFTPQTAYGGEPIWLLWVDQSYRVAVLGTPSGHFGVVLSRQMPPRSDLIRAAHEVLDFNRYDVKRIGR